MEESHRVCDNRKGRGVLPVLLRRLDCPSLRPPDYVCTTRGPVEQALRAIHAAAD